MRNARLRGLPVAARPTMVPAGIITLIPLTPAPLLYVSEVRMKGERLLTMC